MGPENGSYVCYDSTKTFCWHSIVYYQDQTIVTGGIMQRRFRSGISASSGLGLSSLSRDELDSIHYATLQILQDTGIKVMNEKALEVFHGGGATVERHEDFGIVSIPAYLVEESAFR